MHRQSERGKKTALLWPFYTSGFYHVVTKCGWFGHIIISRGLCTNSPPKKSQLHASFPPYGIHLHPNVERRSRHFHSEVGEANEQCALH